MIKRRNTRLVKVKSVKIGAGEPIVIQSMTKVPTTDAQACLTQINTLVQAGCDLVRVAVPTRADTRAFAEIVAEAEAALKKVFPLTRDKATIMLFRIGYADEPPARSLRLDIKIEE